MAATTDSIRKSRQLVIRASRTSLSFSTATTENEVTYHPYAIKNSISLTANLREAMQSEPLLADDYTSVLVLVDSPVLMVPTEFFQEQDMETLFHHAFPSGQPLSQPGQDKSTSHVVMHTVLPDLECVAVFSVHKDLRTVLSDRFGKVSFTPTPAPVWRHFHQRSFTGPRAKLYAYFHDRRMEVFNFSQNRFRFCNSFAANNTPDALYYLLAVWKQLSLVPEHDELYLAGELPDGEQLKTEAQRFLKRVYLINPAGEFNRAAITQIKGMPYDLMTLFVKGR